MINAIGNTGGVDFYKLNSATQQIRGTIQLVCKSREIYKIGNIDLLYTESVTRKHKSTKHKRSQNVKVCDQKY